MSNRILYIIALLGMFSVLSVMAQDDLPKNGNTQKIKGTRLLPYLSYDGKPYLNDKFTNGEIEFLDGTKIANIAIRYSSYRDEIIYYNTAISAQIIIDKISLNGFSFSDENGVLRVFRRMYYNGYMPGDRYFEVLSEGDVSLLVYRKVVLQVCSPYIDSSEKLKNMSYQEAYNYYLYNGKKGYELIRIGKNSLLSKFDKPTQVEIKKLLRKNKVSVSNESGFVRAWNLIKENGIKINH